MIIKARGGGGEVYLSITDLRNVGVAVTIP
jgi:hypothetical protein